MSIARILFGLMLAAVIGSAIALVYARHQNRQLFYKLESMNAERNDLNLEWGRMQIQHSYLADPAQVESAATTRMGMKFPAPQEIVVIAP